MHCLRYMYDLFYLYISATFCYKVMVHLCRRVDGGQQQVAVQRFLSEIEGSLDVLSVEFEILGVISTKGRLAEKIAGKIALNQKADGGSEYVNASESAQGLSLNFHFPLGFTERNLFTQIFL